MSKLEYLDFNLLIEGAKAEGYEARVLESPAGQAVGDFTPPFSGLELENFFLRVGRPRQGVRRLDSPEMEAAKAYGARLFSSLFTGEVYDCFLRALATAQTQGKGLRLRLRIGAPELNSLPWEFLHNPHVNRFLSLSLETPIVRYLEVPQPAAALEVSPPLNMLIMVSSPTDYPPLKVEEEFTRLQKALEPLEQRGLVAVDRLDEATLEALQKRLRTRTYHILHFIGHGGFDPATQDGVLLFEDANQRGRPLSGQYLGTLLHDHRSMRLVVLNACEGARASAEDAFSGVAQGLVQQGLPAVIAMQFEITDQAALTFAQEFYTALADGYPVDGAVAEARKSIFAQGNDIEWGTPVFFTRSPDGVIFNIQADATHPDEARVPAALVFHDGPRRGQALKLFAGPNIMGREPGNRIVLDDEMVSRRHASLYHTPAGYILKDLNSTHGTWVNGQRLQGEQALKDGDLVRMGSTTLRFCLDAGQPAGGTAPVPAAQPALTQAPAPRPAAASAPPARLAPAPQPASRPVSGPAPGGPTATLTPRPAPPSIFSRRLLGIPVWLMGLGLLPVLALCVIALIIILPGPGPAKHTAIADETEMAIKNTAIAADETAFAQPTNTPEPAATLGWATPTPAPADVVPEPRANLLRDDFGVFMAFVDGGPFQMGNKSIVPEEICWQYNPLTENCSPANYLNEEPPRIVYLDAFLIDVFEVSNDQYLECVNAGYCSGPTIYGTNEYPDYFTNPAYANYPRTGVIWAQADTYCAWRGARLPTEAEWEMAARGTDGRQFPWGDYYDPLLVNGCDSNCDSAWRMPNYDDGYPGAAPVNAFPEGVSPYGIYNMAGNAAELVADFYEEFYYATFPDGTWNPLGPMEGEYHVFRGGSWSYSTDMLRTGARFYIDTVNAYPDLGFRCARNP